MTPQNLREKKLKKRNLIKEPDSRDPTFEEGKQYVKCHRCVVDTEYYPWELAVHLERTHKIKRKDQMILPWTSEDEKAYLKNKNKPLKWDKEPPVTDPTSSKEYEKEKQRIKKELDTKRDR